MSINTITKTMEDENMSVESDNMSDTSYQSEGMSGYSKKIVKKRKKYSKIDDEIRMKLLEDVEKNGDTLKAAAKRYNVNYSSAKSIFHTYRKEGRILKKPARERYRRKPLLPPQSLTKASTFTTSSVVSDTSGNNNKPTAQPSQDINALQGANQVISQFDQIQTLTTLLKAAQENSILQQLQNIESLLRKTIGSQEANNAKENVPHIFIPKPIRPIQIQDQSRVGQKSSTTPTNKHVSLFSRLHPGNGAKIASDS